VAIDDAEGAQADNVRYVTISTADRPSIVIVGATGSPQRDGFYVQQALAAGRGRNDYQITGASGAQLSAGPDTALASASAVVLLSTRGLERRGREALAAFLRDGGGLLLAAGPEIDGEVAADVLGGASAVRIITTGIRPDERGLAPAEVRHPIFRPFAGASATLSLARFHSASHVDGGSCQTLARFTTGDNALIECPSGEGRALIFASDLDRRWNDFPLHASFVPFLHETIRYLSSGRVQMSDFLVGDAPAPLPRTPGIHELPAAKSGAPARRVAVNVDPREADPARISADDFRAAVAHLNGPAEAAGRVEARQQEDDQHLWQYLLALMITALAIEGVIASRTA
jgi:hypothetical protein